MKKLLIGMIAFFSVMIVLLVAFMLYVMAGGGSLFDRGFSSFNEGRLVSTYTFDLAAGEGLEEIRLIDIDTFSNDVYFFKSDGDKLVINEYAAGLDANKSYIYNNRDGDTLKIACGERNTRSFIVFGNHYRYLEVYLPETFHGDLDAAAKSGDISVRMNLALASCLMETSSGDIDTEEITAGRISLKSSSGEINARILEGEKVVTTKSGDIEILGGGKDADIGTSSGEITLSNMTGALVLNNHSGDIHADGLTGTVEFRTHSGDVEIDNLDGPAKVITSSGSVDIMLAALNGDLEIETASGSVEGELPEPAAFDFEASTRSGDIETDFDSALDFNNSSSHADGTIGDGAGYTVSVQTSSGDIDFYWLN